MRTIYFPKSKFLMHCCVEKSYFMSLCKYTILWCQAHLQNCISTCVRKSWHFQSRDSLWVNSIQCKTYGVAGRTRQSCFLQMLCFSELGHLSWVVFTICIRRKLLSRILEVFHVITITNTLFDSTNFLWNIAFRHF